MAEACYDPRAALGLWTRMQEEERGNPPQFLSTHPSAKSRIARIQEWLPAAEVKSESSGCGMVANYGMCSEVLDPHSSEGWALTMHFTADDFKTTFERWT